MVTVSVLSLGLVLINGSLLRIADLLSRYNNSLAGYRWMNEKIWESKEALFYSEEPSSSTSGTGVMSLNRKDAYWVLRDEDVAGAKGTHLLDLSLGWQQGQEFIKITKTCYASRSTT